ncbi:MAG: amidohydrolase [Proteobacteria bacterium]|nr:amidohydrolase [Pseudomonadota bacterium]MBU1584446.1 amidohydrolase [Pseudomonadota bacterium]MBU2451927.1 amidohydrolase [Pseudomonadota bacterium]MBU2628203.1 amidohydrolase [Pseudomonadota bacterium]
MTIVKTALIVQNCIAGNFKKNLESSRNFILSAVQKGARIIVFPEMNLTGYVAGPDILSISRPINEDLVTVFSTIAKELTITILIGLAERTLQKKIYATHLVFLPDGSYETYRKIHTAPFEKKYFTPGNKISLFQSHGLIFGVQLCYDAHFPELSLAMALKKADVIFIPHASPRGSSQEKYESWIRHLRARAFDNGIYIAACNQTGDNTKGLFFPGISIFIGPDGNIINKSIDESEGVHIVTIKKTALDQVRSHKMKYFLPYRRKDLFNL